MKFDIKAFKLDKLAAALNKYKYPLLVLGFGLVLVFASVPNSEAPADSEENDPPAEDAFRIDDYERRIEELLFDVEGVGRVKVLLSAKSGMESVYAEENRTKASESSQNDATSSNREEENQLVILSNGSNGEAPIMMKQIYPEFSGVVVVCDGADNATVRLSVTGAVSSLTGLTSEKISVIKMKE